MRLNKLTSITAVIVASALLICVLPAFCGVSLNVHKQGSYLYWFEYTDASGNLVATVPTRFNGASAIISKDVTTEGGKNVKLFIADRKSGLEAVIDYSKPQKSIVIKKEAFHFVGSVLLNIVAEDNSPVESAILHITDAAGNDKTVLVVPSNGGVAHLTHVAEGQASVKVETENLKKTLDSDIDVVVDPDSLRFERNVRVSGDVNTLPKNRVEAGSTKRANSGGSTDKSTEQKPGGAGSLLQSLAGVLFLAIVVAVVYAILKAKGVTVKDVLQKAGLQVPGNQALSVPGISSTPAVDPSICQFCGQKKDVAGNCACAIVGGSAVPLTSAVGVSVIGPRLVGTQGIYASQIFKLDKSQMVIGREPQQDIPLPNDGSTSRRHAVILSAAGEYIIRDGGSSNGTFVNGARITEQKLSSGDEIQIGGTRFRLEL